MEKNNMTAVEWLYNYLFPKQLDGFSDEEWDKIDKAFEQAKQMEKEQIMKAHKEGNKYNGWALQHEHEQYYNETYGNESV